MPMRRPFSSPFSLPILFAFAVLLSLVALSRAVTKYDDKFRYKDEFWSDAHRNVNSGANSEQQKEATRFTSLQPGYVFQYRYDSQTVSGYAPWVSAQRAMGRFQALVSFEMVRPGEATMRLSECLVGHLNGNAPAEGAWNPAVLFPVAAFELVTQLNHSHLERPIRFAFSREGIHSVFFEPTEAAWSRNLKKAILSTAQCQLRDDGVDGQRKQTDRPEQRVKEGDGAETEMAEDKWLAQWQRSYSVLETTIEGTCEVHYTMVPLSHRLISVTKSINFDRCTRLADIAYGLHADEEAKQRGEQQQNNGQKQTNGETDEPNVGPSPMIARQFLDRSTTVRFLFFDTKVNAYNSSISNSLEFGNAKWPLAQTVESVSQYVLKGSQAEQSQAMQTVAVTKMTYIGTKKRTNKKRKQQQRAEKKEQEQEQDNGGNNDSEEMVKEQLMYNGEMEQQEKCFFMFGDEVAETLRCTRRAKAFTNDELRGVPKTTTAQSDGPESPFPLNFPNSTAKIRLAEHCLRKIAQSQVPNGDDETAQAMSRTEFMDEFVQIVRFSTEQELQQLKERLDNDPIASQLFADALSAAGTRNSLKVLLTRIEQGEFTELRAAQLLKVFSRGNGLPAPSDRIADELLALCKSKRVQNSELLRQTSWLSFGAIVGELAQLKRLLRRSPVGTPLGEKIEQCPDHKMELYTKALVEQFSASADDDLMEKTIALKAIGNAALDDVPKVLEDFINSNGTTKQRKDVPKGVKRDKTEVIRQNAIEALRRIPSEKVHLLLLPIFSNQQEWHETRIVALEVLMQSQLSPSESVIEQIAFTMAKERCMQLLAYAHSTLTALSQSPAKRHQKNAQRIKAALLMAGVDPIELEQRIRQNDVVGVSRFSQTNALYSDEEGQGILLQASRIFGGKTIALPSRAFVSLSSLFNGQMSEEQLKLSISQRHIERLLTEAGLNELLANDEGETEEEEKLGPQKAQPQNANGTQPQKDKETSSASTSLLSSAADQLRALWHRLSIMGRSDDAQNEGNKTDQMGTMIVALRVNNIDTVVIPFGMSAGKRTGTIVNTMKKLITVGIGSIARLTGISQQQQQQQGIDAAGILFWHERAARVPMSTGQQLNIQQKSFTFGTIKANAERLGHSQVALLFHPSATFGRIQKMKVWASPIHSLGLKHVGAIDANLPLNAQLNALSRQKQIKLNLKVPNTSTRLFSFHTLPMTFVGTENIQNAVPQQQQSSPFLHFGEQCKAVRNRQLRSMATSFDNHYGMSQSLLQLPLGVRGILHRPRQMNKLKEWVKVLLSTENHYQVSLEPAAGYSPHEIAFSLGWDLFQPQTNIKEALSRLGFKKLLDPSNFAASNIGLQSSESEETDEEAGGQLWAEPISAVDSEEDALGEDRDQRIAGTAFLEKLMAQKVSNHMLKVSMDIVGSERNSRHAELRLDTLCGSGMRLCALRTQLKRSMARGQNWAADLRVQFLFPEQSTDLEQVTQHSQAQQNTFMSRAEMEWTANGQAAKQKIALSIKGEPSVAMLQLAHQFSEQQKQQNQRRGRGQLPTTAGHPFVDKYALVADWTLLPNTQNAFLRCLETVKSAHFFNAVSKIAVAAPKNGGDSTGTKKEGTETDQQQQQEDKDEEEEEQGTDRGQTMGTLSIDPLTQRHLNVSVHTPGQLTVFRMVPVASPLRPFPLVRPLRLPFSRSATSLAQLLHQIAHPLRSNAVCRVTSSQHRLRTFDGAQLDVPISPCWTVLAKDCSAEGRAQYAVMVKAKPNGAQMKLKVITPKVGLLLIEPHPQQPDQRLQLRHIGTKQQQNTTFSSDTPVLDIPWGIHFERSLSTKKESVTIESLTESISGNESSEGRVGGATGAFSVHFDGENVQIMLNGVQNRGQSCGLCGDWNGDAADELRLPNGHQTDSAKEFLRAYSLVDEEGEEEEEEESECESSDILDKFHAQNEESGEGQEQKQRKEPAKEQQIVAVPKTLLVEFQHQLCFSVHPVKQCPVGTLMMEGIATGSANDGKEGQGGQDQTHQRPKQHKVPFACVERHSSEAKRLQEQARRGEVVQMGEERPISFQEEVVEADQCVKVDSSTNA